MTPEVMEKLLSEAAGIEKLIGLADLDIEELKVKLKDAKEQRELRVTDLREIVKRQDEPLLTDQ